MDLLPYRLSSVSNYEAKRSIRTREFQSVSFTSCDSLLRLFIPRMLLHIEAKPLVWFCSPDTGYYYPELLDNSAGDYLRSLNEEIQISSDHTCAVEYMRSVGSMIASAIDRVPCTAEGDIDSFEGSLRQELCYEKAQLKEFCSQRGIDSEMVIGILDKAVKPYVQICYLANYQLKCMANEYRTDEVALYLLR